MRIAIHQPNYLPYVGFFHKIYLSDVFVILDTVQFVKSGPLAWMNRNKIRTAQGWTWLTVPVLTKGRLPVTIKDALIDTNTNWRKKHHDSIYQNYHKSPFYHTYAQFFEDLYRNEWKKLSELNERILYYVLKQLGISTRVVKASELPIDARGSDLLIAICKYLGADTYIYGKHGRDYMDMEKFKQNNITLQSQNFVHPHYKQLHQPFMENMSVIDLLFNEGDKSMRLIEEQSQ